MTFGKILQCFNPLRTSHSVSRRTSGPVISDPFDVRWLYHETDDSRPPGDDPDGDAAKLRHAAGPGFQFMSVTSDSHSFAILCLNPYPLISFKHEGLTNFIPGQISTTKNSLTLLHNSTTSPRFPNTLHTSSLLVTLADLLTRTLCSLLCSRYATNSRKSCTSQETTSSTAPRDKMACALQTR